MNQTDMNLSQCFGLQESVVTNFLWDNIAVGIFLFILAFLFAWIRYEGVFKSSKATLDAQIEALKEKIVLMKQPPHQKFNEDIAQIEEDLASIPWHEKYLVNSQKLLEGWRKIHTIELLLIEDLYPKHDEYGAFIHYRLQELAAIFKKMKHTEAAVLSKVIDTAISEQNSSREEGNKQPGLLQLSQLFKESLRFYYKERDAYYEKLSDWYNKVILLVFMAFLFAFFIDLFEEHAFILIGGGIGGLLSKLRSVTQTSSASRGYGFNWVTLFLTPLVGILTGWVGFYLFVILFNTGIFNTILNPALLKGIHSCSVPVMVVISILFGYSAGLFEKMVGQIEAHVASEDKAIDESSEDTKEKEGNPGENTKK